MEMSRARLVHTLINAQRRSLWLEEVSCNCGPVEWITLTNFIKRNRFRGSMDVVRERQTTPGKSIKKWGRNRGKKGDTSFKQGLTLENT
jgi:hypothetical protein